MTMPLRQRPHLEAALKARQQLSRHHHDRGSRLGDCLFLVCVALIVAAGYLVVSVSDQRVAEGEQQQRTAQR